MAASERALVASVRKVEAQLANAGQQELRHRADELRERRFQRRPGWLSEDALIEACALVCAAARQTLNTTLFDVQLLAGLAMARGTVAEMATGEGKTFAAAVPAFIHSLSGRGVHVNTSNEYLSQRDCEQLQPLFEFLDTSCGHISSQQSPAEKTAAYRCDVTYGGGAEFGFDYLRDQLTLRQTPRTRLGEDFLGILRGQHLSLQTTMQRELAVAIVDEVDNVLIDDAGSPLLLSGQPDGLATDAEAHLAAKRLADELVNGHDFRVDTASGSVNLTESGTTRVWEATDSVPLKCLLRPWNIYVEQAVRARMLFRRDVQYVIRDEEVVIVDQSTGRLFEDRSWSDGLHQAIEARENVPITGEKQGLAKITRQRFFRLYPVLCGMTGTATGSEREFAEFYRLSVSRIPLRKPSQRQTLPGRVFLTEEAKWSAIVSDIKLRHEAGQPILAGTRSIARSELLAERLNDLSIPLVLLNARQDADEAAVIARAGQPGAVTISTNIAGRGTDIRLAPESLDVGGLCVLATEHHDSGRVDRQLVGRSGRQGEPGCAGFYLSADDDLLTRHGDWLSNVISKSPSRKDEVVVDMSSSVRKVQLQAERIQFLQRRALFVDDRRRDVVMSRINGEAS
ncbi:MAG: preprotein translocase subunit SecA [Planctomycetota bacterium]|nr:preprotein translocase subunit SecA [Planctomycetota bacterium]